MSVQRLFDVVWWQGCYYKRVVVADYHLRYCRVLLTDTLIHWNLFSNETETGRPEVRICVHFLHLVIVKSRKELKTSAEEYEKLVVYFL